MAYNQMFVLFCTHCLSQLKSSLTQPSHLVHYQHKSMGQLLPMAIASRSKVYYEFLRDNFQVADWTVHITQMCVYYYLCYIKLTHCPFQCSTGNVLPKVISKCLMRIWEAMTKCTVDSLSQA